MKLISPLMVAFAITFLFVQTLSAQQADTIRQKHPNGWEFFQIRHNNIPYQEGYYKDGVQQGTWILYYANGAPASIISYLDGKKNGLLMQYNGSKMVEKIEHYD